MTARLPRPSTALEVFDAPYLGMDTESPSNQVKSGYARDITNALTGTPGRLPMRGGLTRVVALPAPRSVAWSSRRGDLLLANASSWTIIDTNWNISLLNFGPVGQPDIFPAAPFTQAGDVVYGIGTTGFLLRWEAGTTSPVKYLNAPTGGKAVAYWLNRIWYLGGKLPGDAAVRTDQIGWSDQVGGTTALPDTAAGWQDDVSGLTNRIVLGSISGTNTPVGLGVLPNGLLIFGKYSVDMLVGSSPSSVTLRSNVSSHGCVDLRTIVSYAGAIIWLAPEGLFLFDGSQEIELSTQIRSALVAAVATANGQASAVLLGRDYLLLSLTDAGPNPTQWLLHLPTRSWSYFSSTALMGGAGFVGRQGAAGARGFICDVNAGVWSLDSIVASTAALDTGSDGSSVSFALTVDSGVRELSGPSKKSQVARLIADAQFGTGSLGTVDLTDALGNALCSQVRLVSDAPVGFRTRSVQDLYLETDAISLSTRLTTAAEGTPSELQAILLEFSTTQPVSTHQFAPVH